MPLDADTTHYDLCARTLLDGGMLYRDALDTNLPGMPWLHAAIRFVAGWRSEVMQAIDLVVVSLIVVLLVCWLPYGASAGSRGATTLLLGGYYLTTSEWCHVQRDVWMLLPAVLALACRRRQIVVLAEARSGGWSATALPLVEGLLWGAAFWIKPYVVVPALLCWVTSATLVCSSGLRRGWRAWLSVAADGLLVLIGGAVAGAAGVAWLVKTGTWPVFWEIMSNWNRQYVGHNFSDGRGLLLFAGFVVRFFPWVLVHLVAVPLACHDLWRCRRSSGEGALLSALYLGWLLQAALLQHLFDYIHVPPVLLGLAVLCRRCADVSVGKWRTVAFACLFLGLAMRLPSITIERLAVWQRCLAEGSSAEVRDQVSLLKPRMSWRELELTEEFLRKLGAQDGEVTCWSPRANALYEVLGIRPPTRYFYVHLNLRVFARQREAMWREFAATRQRYLVCDVLLATWKGEPERSWAQPLDDPALAPFPRERLLFRAGRYAVYALDGTQICDWVEKHLEL
jgi:hypothetical protein